MKRIVTLVIALAFIVGLFSVPSSRVVAQEVEMNGSVDLIIQTDGPTSALVDKIEAVGGTVKYAYRNIPAVAASIPAAKVAEVIGFQGVTRYEKDKMVYPSVEKDTVGPTSYAVKDMKGIKLYVHRRRPDLGSDRLWRGQCGGSGRYRHSPQRVFGACRDWRPGVPGWL